MKPSVSILSAAAAVFMGGVLSYAQAQDSTPQAHGHAGVRRAGPGVPGEGEGMRGGLLMKRRAERKAELGITDAQEADIKKVRETTSRDRRGKASELKAARKDLQTLLRADTVDEQAVNAKLTEIQAAQSAMMKIRVDSTLAMKRILTPEQRKKMAEMRAGRSERVGKRRHDRRQRFHERSHSEKPGDPSL
ncbi:MAG: Spy/CpxP family protein refolding chaperone [Vicinamibacteria bacterium]